MCCYANQCPQLGTDRQVAFGYRLSIYDGTEARQTAAEAPPITAQGDHFIVAFDGKKVLDAHHAEFKNGAIGLQYTGQPVELRSIKVKTL